MDECELILFISTLACSISKCYTAEEISVLSAIFTQLGDTLATLQAKKELKENNCDNSN